MKPQNKLAATFMLAAAAALGAGAQTANAQAMPAPAPYTNGNYGGLSQQSIDMVASYGPAQWYQYVGEGFRQQRIPQTGEWVGIEFTPDGYVPYDLNNPAERQIFVQLERDASFDQTRIYDDYRFGRAFDPYCYPFYGRERLMMGGIFAIGIDLHRGWGGRGLYGEHFGYRGGGGRFTHEGRYEHPLPRGLGRGLEHRGGPVRETPRGGGRIGNPPIHREGGGHVGGGYGGGHVGGGNGGGHIGGGYGGGHIGGGYGGGGHGGGGHGGPRR